MKSNVTIEENIENKSYSITWVPQPQKEPIRALKGKKNTINLGQIQNQNWRNNRKWKLFNYMTQKQFWALHDPKSSPLGPHKVQNKPKIKSN